ncbi:sulfatase-like hydrolase/transferase [Candidatus Woesearchaeota archaeon]|jgi:hypothetical protein|nr:sulfatase-like hydrolase/transferase [Candidatus Woesearchaeota archaeon]
MIERTICMIIDALRFDCFENKKASEFLFPNLNKIINKGTICRAFSNSQTTQFVLPSIFCQNYPLDYKGYANGILSRPSSYVELISKSGYETQLISSCNQLGLALGYNRGFDKVKVTADFRVMLEERINRHLKFYLSELRENKGLNNEIKKNLLDDYRRLLDGFIEATENTDTSVWNRKIKQCNSQIAKQAREELKLLNTSEDMVIDRLQNIPPGIYWYVLGRNKIPWMSYNLARIRGAIAWRWVKYIKANGRLLFFPFVILSHWVGVAEEVFDELTLELRKSKKYKQHFHLHVMDLHDCRAINRPIKKIIQFKKFPKWIYARVKGLTDRHYLYDLALMSVDEQIGHMITTLEELNLTNKTSLVVSGDHASHFAKSPREYQYVGFRTHYEDINIPIIAYNCGKEICAYTDRIRDSMSITATLLDFMDINPDISFLGSSIVKKNGRDFAIVESAGSKLFNNSQTNLFLTLITKKYKLIGIKMGGDNTLFVKHLYNCIEDPEELDDLANNKNMHNVISGLTEIIHKERQMFFSQKSENYKWEYYDAKELCVTT